MEGGGRWSLVFGSWFGERDLSVEDLPRLERAPLHVVNIDMTNKLAH